MALTGVTLTGAQHGAAINNISSGSTPARLTVTGSTIAHNTNDGAANDQSQAAGISSLGLPDPQVTVVNSTIADNSLGGGSGAGAIYTDVPQPGAIALIADTITANQGDLTGGVYSPVTSGAPVVPLSHTVIAGNTGSGDPDCDRPLADGPGAHNLIGNGTGCTGLTNNTNGDQVGSAASPIDSQLAPLAYNGGSTETAPPLVGSPSIGTGAAAACEDGPVFDLDHRGDSRHASTRGGCDIGADHTGNATPAQTGPTITSPASAKATVAKALTFKITVGADGVSVGERRVLGAADGPAGGGVLERRAGVAVPGWKG